VCFVDFGLLDIGFVDVGLMDIDFDLSLVFYMFQVESNHH